MKNQEPKQYVSKALHLNSVPKSEDPTDNILVQGADKMVKFIPRNEFNSGIGEISGNPNSITKFNAFGNNLEESDIIEENDRFLINKSVEINSQIEGESGLKFNNLKNESKTLSEVIFDQDVTPSAGYDGTAYFPWGNIVKKVNLDKTITDFYTFPEGCFVQAKIIVSPNNGDLFAIYFDGISSYKLVKFDESGVLSVLKSSILGYSYLANDKNDNIYVEEHSTHKILRINTINSNEKQYYTGNLSLGVLGFDLELNGYFYDYDNRNLIYKINPDGNISNFATLSFEIGTGCAKDDGSLYITAYNEDDKNIYSIDKDGNTIVVFATLSYKSYEPYISENGFLYVHNNNYDNGLVYKISPTGQVSLLGSAGNSPRYMAVTRLGVVYISNSASYNLIKISSEEEEKLLTLDENGNVVLSSKEVISAADFKTINGESLIGSGDIRTSLQSTLDNNRIWYKYDGPILKSMFSVGSDTGFGNNSFSWFNERGSLFVSGQETNPIGFALSSGKNTNESVPITPAITLQADLPLENGTLVFKLPNTKTIGEYTIATTDDIKGSPVSATESGIVNNDLLQELGGTDKSINGIRIGKGNANFENNLVIGRNGLASVTTGKYNVAIGNGDGEIEGPLQYLTTGTSNTMVGSDAGVSTISGNNNTGIGALSLFENTTGSNNTAIGFGTLASNTEGSSNTALGVSALNSNTTGTYNDAFGRRALSKSTTAIANTAVGSLALAENMTSPHNVAIGCNALSKMVSALGQSTAIGAFCMSDATGTDKNAAIGTYALRYNTSGFSNTAIGHTALGLNTSGHSNNAIGNYSLGAVTTGVANTGIGKFAGRYITTGSFNIYIGSEGVPADAESSGIINIGNTIISKGGKISLAGNLNVGTTRVYENNVDALAGGLTAGDIYRTSTGILMITY